MEVCFTGVTVLTDSFEILARSQRRQKNASTKAPMELTPFSPDVQFTKPYMPEPWVDPFCSCSSENVSTFISFSATPVFPVPTPQRYSLFFFALNTQFKFLWFCKASTFFDCWLSNMANYYSCIVHNSRR